MVEVAGFLVAVQSQELIYECIHHYNLETKKIVLPDDTILILIDRKIVVNCLCVPEKEEFFDLIVGGVASEFLAKKMI